MSALKALITTFRAVMGKIDPRKLTSIRLTLRLPTFSRPIQKENPHEMADKSCRKNCRKKGGN